MAIIELRAYAAQPSIGGCFSVSLNLGNKPDPFPKREIEARTTAAAVSAFDAYKQEAAATGKPMALSMRLKSGRAPSGFRQIPQARTFQPVNL